MEKSLQVETEMKRTAILAPKSRLQMFHFSESFNNFTRQQAGRRRGRRDRRRCRRRREYRLTIITYVLRS